MKLLSPSAGPAMGAGPARRVIRRWAAIVVLAGTGAACDFVSAESAPKLEGAYPTAEALVDAALLAVSRQDRPAMEALLVTREEHRELLWDALPESAHLSFEYARWLNEHNTDKAIGRALERFGGEEFRLARLEFTKKTERYDGFTLHRGARLSVVRGSDEAEGELVLLDVLVERPEGWKLLDYEE